MKEVKTIVRRVFGDLDLEDLLYEVLVKRLESEVNDNGNEREGNL